jgi:hypothetical protein
MSYIIKNNVQGAIVARLTDAGRKKLSEGKLNVGLFQLGDSEVCYDCYTQLPANCGSLNVMQAEHNAQNLTPLPEKNKGHIKYPFKKNVTGDEMFGPVIQQHNIEEVFNTATPRGFFDIPTQSQQDIDNGHYDYFSAKTGTEYTLSSDWLFCGSAMTGTTTMVIKSATTSCSTQRYSPVVGDLISVTYSLTGASHCSALTAISQTLFYQVTAGNTNAAQTDTDLTLTVDRETPNFSGDTGNCYRVRVYPNPADNPMTTDSIYSANNTTSYWCDSTLSFNDCCSISTADAKIWNMNINWTSSVAGIVGTVVNDYGSSGYCGTKEYFGYNSNEGQTFEPSNLDYYRDIYGGTWYYDSGGNVRVVQPEEQKCIGILHYTNDTTTDFYGEKFSMKDDGYLSTTTIGEAKNFKLHLPWLMWHKKHINGSGSGTTGNGDETAMGQTFYVNPKNSSGYHSWNALPNLMKSTINANLNNDGLRYYDLTDDNVGSAGGGSNVNIVGKVYPDYKMVIIDDEELLAAMSYKSNRSYTLPVPVTSKMLAGTSCASGCTDGVLGALNTQGERIYITYLLEDTIHNTTGMHCNKYVYEEYAGSPYQDVSIKFDSGFPYLGNGIKADKLKLLYQIVPNAGTLDPTGWWYKDVTSDIVNHSSGQISATNLIATTFYLTGVDLVSNANSTVPGCSGYTSSEYIMNDFVAVSTSASDLQFGDEYFFYGSLETDIMATIYEMRHVVQLGTGEFETSLNPTWVDYSNAAGNAHDRLITEIGLYDNENGVPDLMAIAKLQSPVTRTNQQQFTITIDF